MTFASTAYTSTSTNRFSHAADISPSSLVAFGSSKLISLCNAIDEADRGVLETLPGHEGLVTCVRFARDDTIISSDDKGFLRCWKMYDSKWTPAGCVQAHTASISALCIYGQCIVTGASDSLVKIWDLTENEMREVQIISMHGRYPLGFALATLPHSHAIILGIAGTDKIIQIWTRSEDTFVRSAMLSGHEDWVRSLAFYPLALEGEPLILASGSQDATIRLWNIEPFPADVSTSQNGVQGALSDELLESFEASLGDLADAEEGGRQISLQRHILTVKGSQGSSQKYTIVFDALLIGHDGGVTNLAWRPRASDSLPTLLSTSTDSSLILWSPSTVLTSTQDGKTSIWINHQRFGDVGGQRLGGFVGGLWIPAGSDVMVWGWAGGWRRWHCNDGAKAGVEEVWNEAGTLSGHCGPVRGLDWSPEGEYLISAGVDQTTRIHGAIYLPSGYGSSQESWHELSRPQVHGYDLVGVAFLDALRFVSIADEKVARVFEAPRAFVRMVKGLKVADLKADEGERALSASVPPLGLSNKAVNESQSQDTNGIFSDIVHSAGRPFEGELAAGTLWPETEKVFGHGYESISLAVSKSRRIIATACKATTVEHAVVRIYETNKWQPVGRPLEGHSLTVTRIAFSPDDHFVLTVSRDRSWRLFESRDKGYVPIAADKSHARIIWDCAWAHEGDVFATASRDKLVKIWKPRDSLDYSRWTAAATIKMKEAATAIAFDAEDSYNRRRLAIGLDTGEILIYTNSPALVSDWRMDWTLDSKIAHVDRVNQLSWRPRNHTQSKQLASCSEDGTLKILIVHGGTE